MEERKPELRLTQATVHTPTMTLKNAVLLARIGDIDDGSFSVDISNVADIDRLFPTAIEHFGRLDICGRQRGG
jgi:NAD(P)-dependent dehydrogenase (short-subunit alcohol dehydrogenase family)